jgi:hypothetical protein
MATIPTIDNAVAVPIPFCASCLNPLRVGAVRFRLTMSMEGFGEVTDDFGSLHCLRKGIDEIEQRRERATPTIPES